MAVELAVAYVSLVPDTSKIAPGLNKAMGGVERDAGRTRILAYNEDDVLATLAVRNWLAEADLPAIERWHQHT